jgi:hypothetical protein
MSLTGQIRPTVVFGIFTFVISVLHAIGLMLPYCVIVPIYLPLSLLAGLPPPCNPPSWEQI